MQGQRTEALPGDDKVKTYLSRTTSTICGRWRGRAVSVRRELRAQSRRATNLAEEEPDGELLGRLLKRVGPAADLALKLALAPGGDLGPLVGVEPAALEDLVDDPARLGLADEDPAEADVVGEPEKGKEQDKEYARNLEREDEEEDTEKIGVETRGSGEERQGKAREAVSPRPGCNAKLRAKCRAAGSKARVRSQATREQRHASQQCRSRGEDAHLKAH